MATAVSTLATPPAAASTPLQAPLRPPETAEAPLLKPDPAPLPPIPQGPGTGIDPLDFVRAHRIQVKDGSLFIDPYLVIHPRELSVEHEPQLRKKMQLAYSINNPSFFESPERAAIALNLGQLMPVSLQAKRAQVMQQVQQFNGEVEKGTDAALSAQVNDRHHPFAAIVRDTVGDPKVDPAALELLKNGLGIYLLLRQKLTEQGYYNRLTSYVKRTRTADQVLGDLAEPLGVSPLQIREAALRGGLDGVGHLLGLADDYVRDVKELANYAATQDFGYNLVEHWHLGRQLLGPKPGLHDKIAAGMDQRIGIKIDEYRRRVRHHYDVPIPVQALERRIASALEMVEPVQRKLMYALGYELCYSPEVTADDIAFHHGVYGLHRKAANDLRDIRGTYRIYFSGKGDMEGSMRTLCHEIAHNLWPAQFTPAQVSEIDALLAADTARFERLNRVLCDPVQFGQFNRLLGAYHAGDVREKQAIIASANDLFADKGIRVDALFPSLHDAFELRHLVSYAQDRLHIEGALYSKSGYDSPQERFREIISRYAELRQVRLRSAPELLNFLAPGLNRVWTEHYIPHLERMYAQVQQANPAPAPVAPAAAAQPTASDTAAQAVTAPTAQTAQTVQPAPVAPVSAAADRIETAVPDTRVATAGIQLTPAVLNAKAALATMGVHCGV